AADSDDHGKGLEAARALAERARSRVEVVIMPAPEGTDWNDQVKGASNV
ncbi:MAG: toprim domain-containing protein, partial [Phenylobacterium sp.]|nr:toprim domain-containing protein [Phenylobacterium sp.]